MFLFTHQINLIAPPLYVVTTNTLERNEGLARLNEALKAIEAEITAAKGIFNIHKEVSPLYLLKMIL